MFNDFLISLAASSSTNDPEWGTLFQSESSIKTASTIWTIVFSILVCIGAITIIASPIVYVMKKRKANLTNKQEVQALKHKRNLGIIWGVVILILPFIGAGVTILVDVAISQFGDTSFQNPIKGIDKILLFQAP